VYESESMPVSFAKTCNTVHASNHQNGVKIKKNIKTRLNKVGKEN
jgi:hypothetical protein